MNWRHDMRQRIILDNGSHMIRYGDGSSNHPKQTQLNLLAQLRKTGQLIYGNEYLNPLLDESTIIQYIKPTIRGVLVNFDREITLWESMLGHDCSGKSITLTHHPMAPEQVHNRTCEVVFEYFGFDAHMPLKSQKALHTYANECMGVIGPNVLVVECSHSATYVVPVFDGEVMDGSIKRIEVGGRILTMELKEAISLKQFEFKHYYLLTNQIKEELCRVSLDFIKEVKTKSQKRYFSLPDYDIGQRGYALDSIIPGSQNVIELNKETIRIPELIFTPSDIGINQKGLIDTINESLYLMNQDLRGYFLENIVLFGGNTLFPNFVERMHQDLRRETKQNLDIDIKHCSSLDATFEGAFYQSTRNDFQQNVITKHEYQERGFSNLFPVYY